MNSQIKSAHAALLNRLSEMQVAPYYATARNTLAEAERVIVQLEAITTAPRGTDAQILKERELTESAVSGAYAFGMMGTNPPPEPTHWLAEWWHRGQRAARAFEIADEAMLVQLRSHGWRIGNRPGECFVYPPSPDSSCGAEVAEAVEWLLSRGHLELCSDQQFVRVLREPGEPG